MNQVTTLMALFQRESWEHPNLIWRIPVGLIILNVVLAIASVSFGLQYFGTENFKFEFNSQGLSFDQGGPGQAAATFFLLSYFLLSQMVCDWVLVICVVRRAKRSEYLVLEVATGLGFSGCSQQSTDGFGGDSRSVLAGRDADFFVGHPRFESGYDVPFAWHSAL